MTVKLGPETWVYSAGPGGGGLPIYHGATTLLVNERKPYKDQRTRPATADEAERYLRVKASL